MADNQKPVKGGYTREQASSIPFNQRGQTSTQTSAPAPKKFGDSLTKEQASSGPPPKK